MTDPKRNDGIHVENSTIGVGAFATGDHPVASVNVNAGEGELARLLAELRQAVRSSHHQLAEPNEVEDTVNRVTTELTASPRPNRTFVLSLLDGVTKAAAAGGAVAEAARALADFVQRLH